MKRLTCALLLACGSVAFAQQQSSDAIPKDLVKLLLGGGGLGASNMDIVVGLPQDFPPALVPRDAKALIATTSPSSMMVIAEAPDLPAELPRFERQLANGGWQAPPASMSMGMGRGGLLTAPPPRVSNILCNGGRQASYTLSPRPAGGSFVRLSVFTPQRPGPPCQPSQTPNSPYGPTIYAEVEIPGLLPPPGARTSNYGASNSSSSDYLDHRLRMQTSLSLPDVLQHYRSQIEKYGWTYQSQAVAEGIAIARYSLTSTKKEAVVAFLSVSTVPGEMPVEVRLYVTRASSRQ